MRRAGSPPSQHQESEPLHNNSYLHTSRLAASSRLSTTRSHRHDTTSSRISTHRDSRQDVGGERRRRGEGRAGGLRAMGSSRYLGRDTQQRPHFSIHSPLDALHQPSSIHDHDSRTSSRQSLAYEGRPPMTRKTTPRSPYDLPSHMPMPMPMPSPPLNSGRSSGATGSGHVESSRHRHLSPPRESRMVGQYPAENSAAPKSNNKKPRAYPTTALSPVMSPTLASTATPFASGEFYPPMNNTIGPSHSPPQYFPLSQWLQAPWLRMASQLPSISFPTMSMPVPIHYVFKPKKVQLTDGNLVLDTSVPSSYLSAVDHQSGKEFETMRYMAVTCDADMVPEGRYKLRTHSLNRSIEIAICLTVNEESPQAFCLTLHSLIKNIKQMCAPESKYKSHKNPIWSEEDSWKKVVICIVADGRRNLNPAILKVLASMGCWQEGVAKNQVNGNAVQAHIFEYSTQVSVDSKMKLKGRTLKNSNKHHFPPIQIVFCLKERHTKKLNSHRWFFNALCPLLQPRITLLTTAGAKIGSGSLFHLWNAFDRNPNTAGACGEIRVAKGLLWWKVLNPIIAAQTFEYKVSSVLEKPFESIFGYISVMPGALVAYRYETLLPEPISGKGPLTTYFEPDYLIFSDDHRDVGEVLEYSYFAEDQILPFLVVTRPHAQNTMQYVRSAWAETELPAGVGSFLGMKRKWQNRRFFGIIYAVSHVAAIWRSGHNIARKLWITLEIIYLGCDTIFWFLALGNYYLVFYYMAKTLAVAPHFSLGGTGFMLMRYIYICLIVVVTMISLGNRPRGQSLYLFILSFVFFACIQAYILFAAGYLTFLHATEFLPYANWESFATVVAVFKAAGYHVLILALVCCYAVYLVSAILYGEPWHMIACFVQFMLLLPSYVSVLGVYAFCNMHEVNWGIKEPEDHEKDPLISRDAIYHASTVLMPDERSVAASYQDALDDLDHKKRPKTSTSILPLHSGSSSSSLLPQPITSEKAKPKGTTTRPRRDDIKTMQSDYYTTFRTRILLFWIVANGALVITVSADQLAPYLTLDDGSNLYVTVVVWIITVGATGRFLGSLVYLLGWVWQFLRQLVS